MSDLTDLVPPPELCKLIPEGEFENSVGIYVFDPYYEEWDFTLREDEDSLADIIPAPTLQEIMAAFPADYGYCPLFCMYSSGVWSMGCEERDLYVKNGTENSSPTVSGLKLWLKLKGIENE